MEVFEKIQIDVKELTDIENYFSQFIRMKLPKFQYSARDVKTGGAFYAYAYANNTSNAALFAAYLCNHLKNYKVNLKQLIFQTDNGSEFIGKVTKYKDKTAFVKIVEDIFNITHQRIPPGCTTWNSDVEAFHKMIEDDFYETESFLNLDNFKQKAYTYLLYFNYKRKNRWKDNQTPYEILISDKNNNYHPGIFNLPPPILEDFLNYFQNVNEKKGGYLVGNAVNFRKNKN